MAKLTASLTRKFSVELTDGQWESAEATFAIEDEYTGSDGPEEMEMGDALRAFVKAHVDAEMKRQREDVLGDPVEGFVEETGAVKTIDLEEPPPLPSEPAAPEEASKEFKKYEGEQGKDYKSFPVERFEVALTNSKDKFLKVYGWPTKGKKDWVACWQDKTEDVFDGGVKDMDLGFYPPPFPMRATVVMTEYKGKPSPGVVVGWERADG
jgi:hypothetical protein